MDTDVYLAMEFLKMRMEADCTLATGPGSDQKVFQSPGFKEMAKKAWADSIRFRALREEVIEQLKQEKADANFEKERNNNKETVGWY